MIHWTMVTSCVLLAEYSLHTGVDSNSMKIWSHY